MEILAHDEDSLSNLFFSEVHRHNLLISFLQEIKWLNKIPNLVDIKKCTLHQQLNFSEFGKPDIFIEIIPHSGKPQIVIIEVKLGTYLESCSYKLDGKFFNNKFNSRLNNQITLRYRAMNSVSSVTEHGFLTERDHLPNSPYSKDQIRRCKKNSTIKILKKLESTGFDFYIAALTSDQENPFESVNSDHEFYPLFFDNNENNYQGFSNLGHVSWQQAESLFIGEDNHFSKSYNGLIKNRNNKSLTNNEIYNAEELFIKGRKIIELNGERCYISCKGYSYAIRAIRNGNFVEIDRGVGDREKYLDLREHIKILSKAPQKRIEDINFWKNYLTKP